MNESLFIHQALLIAMSVQVLSILITLYQAMTANNGPERITALDVLSIHIVTLIILYSILAGDAVFLDVAIALALVAFLGTIALTRHLLVTGGREESMK